MASKSQSRQMYVCQQCGSESPKWQGRCPDCGEWNSFTEITVTPAVSVSAQGRVKPGGRDGLSRPVPLPDVQSDQYPRLVVPGEEFNRVLGGGIVPGSLVLIGGDPGIGKSTLLLQVSAQLAAGERTVLYVSAEESTQQIKLRADRLGLNPRSLLLFSETDLDIILNQIQELKPGLVVVDSIQTVFLPGLPSASGSVTQVRECTARLMHLAKAAHIPMFIVGHVTKEGAIAGPRVLEHMVDAVLYLEGDRFHQYRLLRGVKNRFGSTNEVGVFEMASEGMIEVLNPSAAFLSERSQGVPGSTVAVTMEGTRPLLIEVQALTSVTAADTPPRRTANGIDINRLHLIVAVLTKRVGLSLYNQDIYVNVVGGMKIDEPAADLAVAVAIASSFKNVAVDPQLVLIGEIGLSGELRSVGQLERRLHEAAKLGFNRGLHPASGRGLKLPSNFSGQATGQLYHAIGTAVVK
jgi:DNA repair protein RadA/Sms